jgi:chorismate dehydratase
VRPQIGHIQFLNCLPLYHMLVKHDVMPDIDLHKDTPTGLCKRLIAGELDISPVPAIEYARHADELMLLPDLAVCSDGKVLSILVVSKLPIHELDKKPFALTNTSATSQVLAKILLKKKYNIEPKYFECPSDLPEMLRESDAALLIGDDALRAFVKPSRFHLYDLGEEWQQYTGAKMVYAVWAVRRAYAEQNPEMVANISRAFQVSKQKSLENMDRIVNEISQYEIFSESFLKKYFSSLRFDLDESFQEGLIKYYQMAKEIGAIEKVPELRFVKV